MMKTRLLILVAMSSLLFACKTTMPGMTEVKTPFTGSKYEGNRRWVRAVASGESMNLETAKDKALLAAKQRLASDVQTQIKNVSENYKGERQADGTIGDFNERFQQLTREVLSQVIVEVQSIDEKVYKNDKNNYVYWVALEARKKIIYQKLKEIAMSRASLSDKDKETVKLMIDDAIKNLEDN